MADAAKPLRRTLWLGLFKLFVFFPILLFLPAGTLRFWQAWLFLLLFVVLVVSTSAYFMKRAPALIERRARRGPAAEKEPAQKIIVASLMVLFFAEFVVPGLDHRFGWSHVLPGVVIASDLVVGIGFAMAFLALRENSFGAATITVEANQRVVTTGPYRIVRHPMYVGLLLMMTFMPLALGSYWTLLIVPLLYVVIIWRLVDEEKYLARNLPGYDEYRHSIRHRLIPFVW